MFQYSLPQPPKVEEGSGTPPNDGDPPMTDAGPKLLRGLLEVFLLESLESQPKHGYALLKEMGETFGQQPNRNRLYPLLAKLVADGYIREVGEPGGNRTLYTLTDAGMDTLRAYRKLPPAFRHALKRIWAVEGETLPPPKPPHATPSIDETRDESPIRHRIPIETDAPPYPCVDATVAFEKDARTGEATLRLSGCPMGAYDYCPECPIFKGVSSLVLTSSTK